MEIRDAQASDLKSIVAIDLTARNDPSRVDFIKRVLASGACIVAVQGDELLAYGVLEYSFFELGFISMVYVAVAHRREGIGRAVVEKLCARCETSKLFSSTNESNQPMQHLFKSLGFLRSGVIHNLDPGDPELVFMLDRAAV